MKKKKQKRKQKHKANQMTSYSRYRLKFVSNCRWTRNFKLFNDHQLSSNSLILAVIFTLAVTKNNTNIS